MELKEITIKLSAVPGPSGCENAARDAAAALLRPFVDELQTDVMGNLIAWRRCGREGAPRILLDAHLDEVGLVVTGHDKGFLRFAALGGVDARMLPAAEVRVLTDPPLFGVIDTMPPHVLRAEDQEKVTPLDKLYIDAGLNEETAGARVPLGTPVVFTGEGVMLHGETLCAKALDNRAGVAVLIRCMELLRDKALADDVVCLLTAQEELGTRGAGPGAFALEPDAAIAIDATFGRTPDTRCEESFPLGGGPAVGVGPNLHRGMTEELAALAKELDIPYRLEVLRGNSGTDAWPIQVSRGGVPTALVSLPVKYMHSPSEIMDLRDAEAAARLVAAYIERRAEGGERDA